MRRGPFAALAFLALALQLMFPAGFMAAAPGQGGSPIVLCTAQGQVTLDAGAAPGDRGKGAPAKGMASCPFAGHAVTGQASPPPILARPMAYAAPTADRRPLLAAPGLGLAAPPPPSQGPPGLI